MPQVEPQLWPEVGEPPPLLLELTLAKADILRDICCDPQWGHA